MSKVRVETIKMRLTMPDGRELQGLFVGGPDMTVAQLFTMYGTVSGMMVHQYATEVHLEMERETE